MCRDFELDVWGLIEAGKRGPLESMPFCQAGDSADAVAVSTLSILVRELVRTVVGAVSVS